MGINEILEKGLADVTEKVNKATESSVEEIKALKSEIEGLKSKTDGSASKEFAEKMQEQLDALDVKMKNTNRGQMETKSFNEVLAETLEANYDNIKNLKPNSGTTNLEMKAVGDMSIAGNFSGATALYQDVRPLMVAPYGNPFLGDILPAGTSNGTQLVVPKENGGEGGIDVWTEGSNKSQVDYDFTSQVVPFKWIAGWVVIDRAMLDDIAWLTSYLQQRLLLDLKKRETSFILNEAVTGMLAQSTAYDGTYTNEVERVIDAAYGQIVDGTDGGYNPTTIITRGRDAVKLGLNKAVGSGEFDLPQGSMSFNNGTLNIGGLQSITTTAIAANNLLVFDRSATQFVKKLQPELRIFEDATLAKQNKIMFRIEERAALAVYNSKALVKGTLTSV